MSKLRAHFNLRTLEQQAAFRAGVEAVLRTYQRPAAALKSWGTPERAIGAFRREYEHMPLLEHWRCIRVEGNYHVMRQTGDEPYYKQPILLEADIITAASIWRDVRNAWVRQWLQEAQQVMQVAELPPATPMPTDIIAGIPWRPGGPAGLWCAVPWEWPEMEWSRETPGVFEVYESDLEELREKPWNLDGVGSCEPEEFEVMHLPNLAALSHIILALYDHYGPDSDLTRSDEVEKDEWQEDEDGLQFGPSVSVFHTKIAFDCREWLKSPQQEGGPADA